MTMRIDLTCPVEAWKSTLPTPEKASCDVTLFNLSSLQVVSVEITLLLSSADGEETARIIHRSRGLNGAPGKTFTMNVPVEGHITPERYEITVEKVWFDNASVWRREKENTITYRPNNLHRSAQLTALRSVAGEIASGYPEQQRDLWLCVCGRPNPEDALLCARCHQEKAQVFARYSREAIDSVIAQREAELAERGRETLQHHSRFDDEKDFVRRRGRHAWVWKLVIALVLIAALGWAGYEYGVPYVKYQLAKKAYDSLDYVAAAEQFAALGDYSDAELKAAASRHKYALHLGFDEGRTPEEIAQAKTLLGEFSGKVFEGGVTFDADLYMSSLDWLQAEALYAEGRYDEAKPLFETLAAAEYGVQYLEVPPAARLQEINYMEACALLDAGSWDDARAAFTALGDYKDSASLRLDTWLDQAVIAMNAGDNVTALALLAEIPGHANADDLVRQIHYDEGVALRAEGKINEAAEAFYLAKGYSDAEEQANECFYVPASVAYEIMEYEKAAELFGKILGYRDADEKWRSSLMEAAQTAIAQINYAKALTYLNQLPATDTEAADLIRDCTYLPAVNAAVRGDYEEAIAGFTAVIDHKDSAARITQCQYEWAAELFAAGSLDKAEALYTALGEYEDSAARLTAVHYAQANAALAAGDSQSIDKAVALYTSLGEYEDSAARLLDANFAKAGLLLAKGDHAAARAIYLALGDYPGAAAQLTACDYAAAKALAAEGKMAEAIAAFEALGEYADAAAQITQLRYDQALALALTDPAAAITALEALTGHADAAAQANELRYQQAEALILTDRSGAIAAFEAIAGYSDAADRANQLRYEDAETLLLTDRSGAISAFEAISGYSDAADRAAALRYEDAAALADTGDWEAAAAAFDLISGYSDAASRANQLRYDAGMAFAAKGEWDKAEAVFSAMDGELDADEQVNALRYAAAENLLAAGSAETAAAAFDAIASYKDAADRANEIRYAAAEGLIKTDPAAAAAAFEKLGDYKDAAARAPRIRYDAADALAATDWAAAAEAFDALGDYEDSADRANALRYNAAAQTAASGDWQTAAALYEALGTYSDSAARALQVRYEAAARMVARQEWDEAVALYTQLGDYADCKERISLTRYAEAQAAEAGGEYLAAAKLYKALAGYKDASAKADEMYDKYYAGPLAAMEKASKAKNHQEVIQIMSWLDVTDLPAKYASLTTLYQASLYEEGNRLFSEGKPYEAWAYYQQLPTNYRAMADKLQRPCYLLLGTWQDKNGNRYIFRGEGICNLNGETMYFSVQDMAVYTGAAADSLTKTHRLNSINRTTAWFVDERGGKDVIIRLERVTE